MRLVIREQEKKFIHNSISIMILPIYKGDLVQLRLYTDVTQTRMRRVIVIPINDMLNFFFRMNFLKMKFA